MEFYGELEQRFLKCVKKHKRTWIVNTILRKKHKLGLIMLPDFKLYYKPRIFKTVWYWNKRNTHRFMEQNWEPRNKHILIWSIHLWQWGEDSLFNEWCWENWTVTCTRLKLESFLIPSIKTTSKWIKCFSVRSEAIQLLEDNIGSMIFDISLGNIFWICLLKQGKQKQNKPMGFHPTEKLFNGKGNHPQNEKAAYWTWENICT